MCVGEGKTNHTVLVQQMCPEIVLLADTALVRIILTSETFSRARTHTHTDTHTHTHTDTNTRTHTDTHTHTHTHTNTHTQTHTTHTRIHTHTHTQHTRTHTQTHTHTQVHMQTSLKPHTRNRKPFSLLTIYIQRVEYNSSALGHSWLCVVCRRDVCCPAYSKWIVQCPAFEVPGTGWGSLTDNHCH